MDWRAPSYTEMDLCFLAIRFESRCCQLSSELKNLLMKVAEEDFKSEEIRIDERLADFRHLILEIAKAVKVDFLVSAEGSVTERFPKREMDLNLLERGNLIKGQMKYTERDTYREYTLTKKGMELAKKLLQES
jgi:hypothetical protein